METTSNSFEAWLMGVNCAWQILAVLGLVGGLTFWINYVATASLSKAGLVVNISFMGILLACYIVFYCFMPFKDYLY